MLLRVLRSTDRDCFAAFDRAVRSTDRDCFAAFEEGVAACCLRRCLWRCVIGEFCVEEVCYWRGDKG